MLNFIQIYVCYSTTFTSKGPAILSQALCMHVRAG